MRYFGGALLELPPEGPDTALFLFFLFGRFTGLHGALLVNSSTCQLIVWQVLGENQAILQLNSEPLVKELSPLRISIHMVTPVLRQIIEFLDILIDRAVSLAQMQKLCKLAVHSAR
jgi:hypothetical protein